MTLSADVLFLYATPFCGTFPLLGGVVVFDVDVVFDVAEVLVLELSLWVLEWCVSPYSQTSSSELKSTQM